MPKYKVTLYLKAIKYEVEAENKEIAIKTAESYAMKETLSDLLKYANSVSDYKVEAIEGEV